MEETQDLRQSEIFGRLMLLGLVFGKKLILDLKIHPQEFIMLLASAELELQMV